jgi:hypothetical protein
VAYPAEVARKTTLNDLKYNSASQPEDTEQLRIYTIGFGDPGDLDEELLKSIANTTGGEYFYGGGGFELSNIFLKAQYMGTGRVRAEYKGKIRLGENVLAGKFNLGRGESELRVALNWPGSEVELRIYDPQGNLLTPQYRGVKLWRTERPAYVVLEKPRAGEWSVELYGKDVPSGETSYYVIASTGDIIAKKDGALEFLLILAAAVLAALVLLPRLAQSRTLERRTGV